MNNVVIDVILLRFYAVLRLLYAILGPVRTEKYHKITKNYEKQNDFSTVFFEAEG